MKRVSLIRNIKGGKAEPCSLEEIVDVCRSERTHRIIAQLRSGGLNEEQEAELKAQLAAVCFAATFREGVRRNDMAQLSGLVPLDVDGIEGDAREVYERCVAPHVAELGVVFAQVSPRGKGLHIIFRWREGCQSIAESQAWAAGVTGLQHDEACKDAARAFYLSITEDILYMNAALFEAEMPEWFTPIREGYGRGAATPQPLPPAAGTAAEAVSVPENVQRHYRGIALADIAAALMDSMGGLPEKGERNSRLFDVASELRNVCDYDPYALFEALKPGSTLPEAELLGLCRSACRYRAKPVISARLQAAIDLCTAETSAERAAESDEITFELPRVMREFYSIAPPDFKNAVVLSLLPVLGTLASRLRSPFNDRMEHASFQEVVIADAGAGKSFLGDVWRRCLRLVIARDEEAQAKKAEWRQLISSYKMQQGRSKSERSELRELLQGEPHDPIRIVPENISLTALLEQMSDADGLHVFQPLDEITIAAAAEKKGWSCISNVLKIAFSGEKYAQNYKSDNSFRGEVKHVMYNTLWASQPLTFEKFFTHEKWEDGTASRVVMVDLPNQRYKPLPRWKKLTPTQEAEVDAALERLNAISLDGDKALPEYVVELPWLEEAMNEWSEQQRLRAQRDQDELRDIYRRRAAVIGYRSGMLCYLLWGEANTKAVRRDVKAFGVWVAERTLEGQMRHARPDLLAAPQPKVGIAAAAFEALPDSFSRQELEQALTEHHFASPSFRIINKWLNDGVIERDKAYGAESFRKKHPSR